MDLNNTACAINRSIVIFNTSRNPTLVTLVLIITIELWAIEGVTWAVTINDDSLSTIFPPASTKASLGCVGNGVLLPSVEFQRSRWLAIVVCKGLLYIETLMADDEPSMSTFLSASRTSARGWGANDLPPNTDPMDALLISTMFAACLTPTVNLFESTSKCPLSIWPWTNRGSSSIQLCWCTDIGSLWARLLRVYWIHLHPGIVKWIHWDRSVMSP